MTLSMILFALGIFSVGILIWWASVIYRKGETDTTGGGILDTFEETDEGDSGDGRASSYLKLSTSFITTRFQPSTRIKRISLKGIEIMTGGSIIIPIAINTELTTMSMTRNGR